MKKIIVYGLIMIMFFGIMSTVNLFSKESNDLPCYEIWKKCVKKNGYKDSGCEALFQLCLYVMYPHAR